MSKKNRILFAGDSLNNTSGLSYVISSLLNKFYFSGKYEIAFVTISGRDTTIDGMTIHGEGFEEISRSIKIYNAQILDKTRAILFDLAVEDFKPNIIISMLDPWILDQIALSKYKQSFFWACLLTIEAPEYPNHVVFPTPTNVMIRKSIKDLISTADMVVPCTKMGKSALSKMGVNPIDPIYLGLHTDKEITTNISKKEAFGTMVYEEDFIFMTVGVNSERKKISKIVESFYKFKQKMTDPHNRYKLYIHSDLDRQQGGTDVKSMISKLKLGDSILYPSNYQRDTGINKEDLYKKYKACNCYIGLGAGEGFGYGYVEAMLHKKPIIYINYGGHVEFCKGVGLPVKVAAFDYAVNACIQFALADTEDCAKQMTKIASDKQMRGVNLEKGYEFACSIDWSIQTEKLMKELEKEFSQKQEESYSNLPLKRII